MPPSPRVRCDGCTFEWYGRITAHGLRIMGTCPRCGGPLDFLIEDVEEEYVPVPDFVGHELTEPVSPAQVLGLPTRWSTR
jgi:hypothetical protein